MVLSKEQKEQLLERLAEGKRKKAEQAEQLKAEQLKAEQLKAEQLKAEQAKAEQPKVEPAVKYKAPVTPAEVIPFEEPLPPAKEYYTNKPTNNIESKKNKYYNKETGTPLMKIKLYREPQNDAVIHNLLNSLSQTKIVEKVDDKKIEPETPRPKKVEKSKEQVRKEYIDKLSQSFF